MNAQTTTLTSPIPTEMMPVASTKVPPAARPERSKASNNGQPTDDVIRLGAYLKWEAAGKPPGDGIDFWLEAEKELNGHSGQSSAQAAKSRSKGAVPR